MYPNLYTNQTAFNNNGSLVSINDITVEEIQKIEDQVLTYCRPDSVTTLNIQVSAYTGVVLMFVMALYASLTTAYRSKALGIRVNRPEVGITIIHVLWHSGCPWTS